MSETWAWSAVGVGVGSTAPIAWTAVEAAYGAPRVWPWLPIMASVLLACAVGASAGRVLPALIAPPLVAAGSYAVFVLMVFKAEGILAALTPLAGWPMMFFTIPAWVYGLQAAMLACAALALVLRSAGTRRAAWVAAWVAGLLAAPLLYVGWEVRRVDEAATRMVCGNETDDVTVCMPAAKAHLVGDTHAVATELWPRVAGLAPESVLILDDQARGLSPAGDRDIASVFANANSAVPTAVVPFSEGITAVGQVKRDSMLVDFAQWLVPPQAPTEDGQVQALGTARPREIVLRWLLTELDVPIDGSAKPGAPILDGSFSDFQPVAAQLDWFTGLSAAERRAWFAAHRDAIASGTLALEAFGP